MVGILLNRMQDSAFNHIVTLICKKDNRFDRRAYYFVRQSLDATVRNLKKQQPHSNQKPQHVSGFELLGGIRSYALDQFGPLAKTVLNAWGVTRCSDFGDIVFSLIDYNIFSKSENDSREDFAEIYSFEEAFVKPFLPARKPRGSLRAA